jgi:hypothetical protein
VRGRGPARRARVRVLRSGAGGAVAAVKLIALLAVAALGALLGLGCLLAALFEVQGFGRPRDAQPRGWYVALLGLGLLACVAGPLALWRLLLPETAPTYGWLALVAAVVVVLTLLGVLSAG